MLLFDLLTWLCWSLASGCKKSSLPLASHPSLRQEEEREVKSFSHVWLLVTLWTVAYQVPQSMGFSGQEHWSGLPFPSPGDLPKPGIKSRPSILQADTLPFEPGKPLGRRRWWRKASGWVCQIQTYFSAKSLISQNVITWPPCI